MPDRYALGQRFCRHCGPPESMGEWKPARKIKDGVCVDCGHPIRNSPKSSLLKARFRGYEGKYTQLRAGVVGS